MQAEGCAAPIRSAGATRHFADKLEQATVALDDARDEAALLARAMEALAAENRALKAELAGEKARLARREAAAEEVRSRFEAAVAEAAAREAASVSREEAGPPPRRNWASRWRSCGSPRRSCRKRTTSSPA